MHYVITGGCGFIGSHLAERLVEQGHSITIIDDLSSGKRENLPPKATLVVRDITAPGAFDELAAGADGFFHLAAIVSVQRSMEDWLGTHRVNLGGTIALLSTLAKLKRRVSVVLASSAAVYGSGAKMPLKETASCAPLSPYGADKLASEWQASIASAAYGIPTAALRFFNVYGPRQDASSPYSGVISIFADRMRRGQKVTVFGDGKQARDFIYVADVVNAMAKTMQKLETKKLASGVFNVCTGTKTSVNTLVSTLDRLTRTVSKITHAPVRAGDIRISCGDPSLARKKLGFTAETSLGDGLRALLETL